MQANCKEVTVYIRICIRILNTTPRPMLLPTWACGCPFSCTFSKHETSLQYPHGCDFPGFADRHGGLQVWQSKPIVPATVVTRD